MGGERVRFILLILNGISLDGLKVSLVCELRRKFVFRIMFIDGQI